MGEESSLILGLELPPAVQASLPSVCSTTTSLSSHTICCHHHSSIPVTTSEAPLDISTTIVCPPLLQIVLVEILILYSSWAGNLNLWAYLWALSSSTLSTDMRSNQPASLHLLVYQKCLKVSYAVIQPMLLINYWWGVCTDGILCISTITLRRGPSAVSLLLEIESLVSLHLIRLKSQSHKPQNQFRKLILKTLFLWNRSWY